MKKRILFIGYNYKPEPTGIGKYTGEMVEWLANDGFDCSVLTTYPYYPYWKIQEPYEQNKFSYKKEVEHFESGGKITIYRCPMYVPSNPTGLKRIILDCTFFITATIQLVKLVFLQRFDFVMSIAPSFQIGLLGILYSKFRSSTSIYHIQDLQIEAAKDFKMINSSLVINLMFSLEKFIFKHTDIISSISRGMNKKIAAKSGKEVYMFPNWTNTAFFYPVSDSAELKENYGFKPDDQIVLYSGAIGEKQGLKAILNVAEKLKEPYKKIKFVICGTGPYKSDLQEFAIKMKLDNVYFLPLQPMESFNEFLNMADVHLVLQKSEASDLVMPSKLTTILGVGGLAVITAEPDTTLYEIISEHNMGFLIKPENELSLLEGIQTALKLPKESKIHKNARIYAEKFLSLDSIMQDFKAQVLFTD